MHEYMRKVYAESLGDYGEPVPLAASGGWILRRPISGTGLADAMGPYPLFACRDWNGLKSDLDALSGQLVCMVAVPDPFGDFDAALLAATFADIARPFK